MLSRRFARFIATLPRRSMNTFEIISVSFLSSAVGLVVLLFRRDALTPNTHAGLTGLSAGVMLGASFLSLLAPAVALLRPQVGMIPWALATMFFLMGAIVMELIHSLTPHEHQMRGLDGLKPQSVSWRRGVLITAAMALHNLPEGLALGIGSLQEDQNLVRGLVYGIAGQNLSEGAMTALAMLAAGSSVRFAATGVLIAAFVEAFGAYCGILAGHVLLPVLPWALMFCGGAMIYVISQEMIPESHANGKERVATFSLLLGLIGMGWVSI